MPKIKRLDTVLGQVLPCQSDPISKVFITRAIIFIFGNCMRVQHWLLVIKTASPKDPYDPKESQKGKNNHFFTIFEVILVHNLISR